VRRVVVHFVYALLISVGPPALAQNRRSADFTISPYLVRVQRKTPRNTICVLLRQDGQFHMETTSRDRTKVLEGSLRSSELLKVHRMLDSGGIPGLSQDKPVPTETTRVSQIVQVSIFRTDHWQNLVFMDENGRQSVPRSLGPLLNWAGSLEKHPHRQLNEDESKNNCQSPKKIELQERP
jgi:hypothetical protein